MNNKLADVVSGGCTHTHAIYFVALEKKAPAIHMHEYIEHFLL